MKMPKTLKVVLFWAGLYALILAGVSASAFAMYGRYSGNILPPGNIQLAVGKSRYQLGERITFTVTNHFPATVYVMNHCPEEPLDVYRLDGGEWVQLHATAESEQSSCYTQPRNVAIPPEGSRSYDFDDWPGLFAKPGVYRIATAIDHYDDIPFQDFVVLEPAPVVVKKNPVVPPAIQTPLAPLPEVSQPAPDTPPDFEREWEEDDD